MGEVGVQDLAAWLLAQVAEDEESWGCHSATCLDPQAETAWCTCGGRERWLVECDTKRRILQIHNTYDAIFGNDPDDPDPDDRCIGCAFGSDERPMTEHIDKCPVLRALALPYVERPGYREEWAPDGR